MIIHAASDGLLSNWNTTMYIYVVDVKPVNKCRYRVGVYKKLNAVFVRFLFFVF